jgi:ribokinase
MRHADDGEVVTVSCQPVVVVVGPITEDTTIVVDAPAPMGTTVAPRSSRIAAGGKGANPAVAVARLGATARLVGAVGDDATGGAVLEQLRTADVDVTWVQRVTGRPTGRVITILDRERRRALYELPGANDAVAVDDTSFAAVLGDAQACLISTALPATPVLAAVRLARERQVLTVVDVAGDAGTAALAAPDADVVRGDSSEVAALVGHPVTDVPSAVAAAEQMRTWGASTAIVQAGDDGDVVAADGAHWLIPRLPVDPVDPTGAGDAFAAALAVTLVRKNAMETAARIAAAAAADTVTRVGGTAGFTSAGLAALVEQVEFVRLP